MEARALLAPQIGKVSPSRPLSPSPGALPLTPTAAQATYSLSHTLNERERKDAGNLVSLSHQE